MSNIDTSISTYSSPDTGHLLVIPPAEEVYLPHHCYVTLALCELASTTKTSEVQIMSLMNKINEVISHLHTDVNYHNTVFDYFNSSGNLIDLLVDLDDSGYISMYESYVEITAEQLEFLYIGILDYFNF